MSLMMQCPKCQHRFNKVLSYCPYCGQANNTKDTGSNSKALCPRCAIPLEMIRLRDNELDICPVCHGMWLDTLEFKRLTSERDVYEDDTVSKEFQKKAIPQKEIKYLPCPRCKNLMIKRNFKKISGVIIDLCRLHGVWLDPGELEQIRSFIANVDYDDYQDTKIELNNEEIESLGRQLRDVELVQRATELWNLKYWMYKTR